MAIRSERDIYHKLEAHLRKAKSPMTVTDLMDIGEVREEALSEFGGRERDLRVATNKVSDTLGFMWRRGLLVRYPAPKGETSFARYSYEWAKEKERIPSSPIPPPSRSFGKTAVLVTEHPDCVEIEFDKFVILVRPKA